MCFNDQRKEEGEFFVLCKDSCPIRMDFEVRIFPYERPDNSDGAGMVVKNGHADFWVGNINIVDFFACDPRHVKESPSFFSILVDDIPEFGIELFLKCIVEGGEDEPWYLIDVQAIFYQREIIPGSARTNCDCATHCKKADIISILHIPLHASGNVLQTCIVDTNATCKIRHSDAGSAPATGTLQWKHVSGWKRSTAGALYGKRSRRVQQLGVCKIQQPNRGYPTLASSEIQTKRLSKHRLSNTGFCRCGCLQ